MQKLSVAIRYLSLSHFPSKDLLLIYYAKCLRLQMACTSGNKRTRIEIERLKKKKNKHKRLSHLSELTGRVVPRLQFRTPYSGFLSAKILNTEFLSTSVTKKPLKLYRIPIPAIPKMKTILLFHSLGIPVAYI